MPAAIVRAMRWLLSHPVWMGIAVLVSIVTVAIIIVAPDKSRPQPFQPAPAHCGSLFAQTHDWRSDREHYPQPGHVNRWNKALPAGGAVNRF